MKLLKEFDDVRGQLWGGIRHSCLTGITEYVYNSVWRVVGLNHVHRDSPATIGKRLMDRLVDSWTS